MIRVRQVKVSIKNNTIDEILNKTSKKLKIKREYIKKIDIIKESIDARNKNNINYVYEVDVEVLDENIVIKKVKSNDIFLSPNDDYIFNITGKYKMKYRPIIVGAGPAGLFCAYMLSKYNYKPLIIERGEKVEDRIKNVNEFWNYSKLNINSNVQFGEGGAGTFSDGKLNTLVKDKENRMKKVFEIFIECGAPKEILYKKNPHIGTDKLRDIIINMRNKIINYGGEFRYNTILTDLIIEENSIRQIEVNNNELINCDNLILAIGHSARDTFYMLNKNKLNMSSKPFAVGIRISHTQKMINDALYGVNSKLLDPANYKLTYKSKDNRGVYSFCMCPGGYVVNSSSEEKRLVINGMSNYKRDSLNANSALVVSVSEEDFGFELFDGMKFQMMLEEKAYKYGNGKIPVQLFKDFLNNKISDHFESVKPIFKGNYEFCNINDILPKYICDDLKDAIIYFNKIINGYSNDDAIIAAVETRTSSPIRIIRDDNYMSNIKGIYPIGEGSGYSGGITTSAMDGIRVSEKLAKIYINE